jgi:translation initiation factor IF-2
MGQPLISDVALQELSAQAQLYPEEWGGDVSMVPVSAKKGTGVDELLEAIMLVAEVRAFTPRCIVFSMFPNMLLGQEAVLLH